MNVKRKQVAQSARKNDEDAEFELIEGGDDEGTEDADDEELTVEAADEPVDRVEARGNGTHLQWNKMAGPPITMHLK